MGSDEKWKPGEPANRQGAPENDAAEQVFGATSAFGMVKPGAAPGTSPTGEFSTDLMSLLRGGDKKHSAPAPAPAVPVSVDPVFGASAFPSGPVVHEVAPSAFGSGNQDDILARLRAKDATGSFAAPAQSAFSTPVPSPVSPQPPLAQPAASAPGSFTQMFQTAAAPPAPAPPAPSSGGFTEIFSRVSAPQSAPEPLTPPVAREPEPFFPPAAAPPAPPSSQPGSFTQIFGSFGGAAAAPPSAPAPVPPAAPVIPAAPAAEPHPGGFTALFSTTAAPERPKENPAAFSPAPESATGAYRRSATGSFSTFGGAASAIPVVPAPAAPPAFTPVQAPAETATASFSIATPPVAPPAASPFPTAPAAPSSSGGFTELFTRLPAEERERGLSGAPSPNAPQPSLTQMFGALNNAPANNAPSAPQAAPPDPSSFTQILSRSAAAPPPSAPWEPAREAGIGFTSRPDPVPSSGSGFGAAPAAPSSDPNMNMSVTRLLSRLDSTPSTPSYTPAPPPPAAPAGDSWTKTFDLLNSPSSPAPAAGGFGSPGGSPGGGYTPAPSGGGEATRAMAMPTAAGPGSGFGSNAAVSAAPESSGPGEVTRIINASKMRESALRSGGTAAQSAPQPAAAPPPAAAPGMPAMPGGMKFTPPQMNPQGMMPPVGMGAAPGAMGGGMPHAGGAPGGMNMPHMQAPPMQMPQMNMQPPAAPAAPASGQAAPNKLQQMIPLLLVVIIFLLVALIVTVIFLMKH